ncbi:MAG: hypothetical protein ABIN89_00985 [Chitinophagaceae bacterium]
MKNSFTITENTSAANLHASKIIYIVKIFLLALIAILFMVLKGSCADSTQVKSVKNTVYIQVAGIGNYRSINFERVFSRGRNLNYSYTIGYAPTSTSTSVPISLNAFTTGKQHHFEMSVAVIPMIEKHTFSKGMEDLDKQMYVKPSVGYRYQKASKGLFVKLAAGPQIFMDPPSYNVWDFTPKLIAPSAQVALGISF